MVNIIHLINMVFIYAGWSILLAILILAIGYRFFTLPASPPAAQFGNMIIAHRGGSQSAPENTLAAIRQAHADGAQAVEIDVHLSKDKIPVVIHDPNVDRTTNGAGQVAAMTLAALRALDASYSFPTHIGEKIPTLDEAIELCLELGLAIEIEIKGSKTDKSQIIKETALRFEKYNLYDKAYISSFYPGILYRVRKQNPKIVTGHAIRRNVTGNIIIDSIAISKWLSRFLKVGLIEPHRDMISADAVNEWVKQGYVVNAWTINNEVEKACLSALGVSYVTNCPKGSCTDDVSDEM